MSINQNNKNIFKQNNTMLDMKREDKRGQGLSTNAIILIILGVVVLVILILGFMMGWGSLKDRLGGGSNVDTIAQACATACSTNSVYDFCNMKRELTNENKETLKDVTCYMLSLDDNIKKYGIQKCSSIDCKSTVKCADWKYVNIKGESQTVIIDTKAQVSEIIVGTDYCSKNPQIP